MEARPRFTSETIFRGTLEVAGHIRVAVHTIVKWPKRDE